MRYFFSALVSFVPFLVFSQPITGIWKGKVKSTRVELKLIKKGDSLVGTSYYYESANTYRRYSIKGYFDDATNNVVWWDDLLIEERSGSHGAGREALMSVADFNCPGENEMRLDGNVSPRDDSQAPKWPLHFQKVATPYFADEWDYVIRNYTRGASDPRLIDSVSLVALNGPPQTVVAAVEEPQPIPVARQARPAKPATNTDLQLAAPVVPAVSAIPDLPLTVEQKFTSRTKLLQTVVPVTGDSIELRFYDNAEIDGDSIAIFLNSHMLEQHILLSDQAHVVKIALHDLGDDNELVMVAENLGSIPPNTSLMVAIVGDNRYEAHLQSTEGSSALVRFVKEVKPLH